MDEVVEHLKKTEEKYKKMKTWCPFLYEKGGNNEK